jgi:hypothetical protein
MTDYAVGSAPASPTSAYVRLYAKSDRLLYYKDYLGVETGPLGAGGGGIAGSGTVDYLPLWTGTTTLSNSILSQAPESGYTCLNSFRMIYNAAIKWMRGAAPDSPDYSGIRGTYTGSALLFWNTASTFVWRYGDADSGYELAQLTTGGNLWIAGKLTQAGCPPEWHDPTARPEMFREYLHEAVGKKEHVTGEEVYALMRVVLDLERKVEKLIVTK